MSSVLVNAAGATTSFGPAASPTGVQANGAEQVVVGCGALFLLMWELQFSYDCFSEGSFDS
jgi:hypothetical protein